MVMKAAWQSPDPAAVMNSMSPVDGPAPLHRYQMIGDKHNVDFVAGFTGSDALRVDITEWNVSTEGGTQMVNVYNLSGDFTIYYMMLTSHSWIHVSPTYGTTPGSFVITVDENTTAEDRSVM